MGSRIKAKDERKGQGTAQDPNAVAQVLHDRSDDFQTISTQSKTSIASPTSFFPPARTDLIDRAVDKVRDVIHSVRHLVGCCN